MAKRDYYEVLGVDKSADEQTIKRSYKRLAMKYHPDRNHEAGAEEKFKEINEAYAVLSDPQKKQAYDQFGFAGVDPNQAGGAGGFGGFGGGGFSGFGGFEDIFENIFGGGGARGGRARPGPRAGDDIQQVVEITLEEAFKGCTKTVSYRAKCTCETCKGSGSKDNSKPVQCPRCGGAGIIQMRQGFFAVQQTCPDCGGSGKKIANPCPDCHGEGRVYCKKTINVKIPAGMDNGNTLRMAGAGEAGELGAQNGDLYVIIKLKPHALFERENLNLHVNVPISFATAALGGKIEVPTLSGKIMLTIKEGTQTGAVLCANGKGFTSVNGSRVGNLLCHICVETPVHLNEKQKELLREFEGTFKSGEESHRPMLDSFISKVKGFIDDLKG